MESFEPVADESMEDVFLQDDLSPTIAEHATQCQSLFQKYMAMPEIVPDPTIIDDQLARFSLWVSNMDVYGPPNVSLDYRLRFSPTAADIIHQLLDIISDTLLSCHTNSEITRRDNDGASDSDSDADPEEENIAKITETIGGTLSRLVRLSNAVRKSAKANRARKIENYNNDEEANKAIDELRLYTKCYIEFRYPEAMEALCSALVEANALRLRRLCYQRTHRRRIDLSIQQPNATPAAVELPKITANAPVARFGPNVLPKSFAINKMPAAVPAPATNATTARQTAVAALYTKPTTEIPGAKSVLVNSKLSFPPIPPSQQCPYCGVIVEFKNTSRSLLWQNHVIGDLEPFICVFSSCLERCHHGNGNSPLTFETSKAWSSHMQTAHGSTWECRAPSHDPIVFDQEEQYREHSIKEHGVPEAYAGTLSNVARRPVLERVMGCPFGDDFQPPEKAEPSGIFSSQALQSHVASHMKEIALLTLQKLPSDDDESLENIDSDQQSEDGELIGGHGITRASMYSILDDEELDLQTDDEDSANRDVEHGGEDISGRVTVLNLEDKDDMRMTKIHQAVQAGDLGLVVSLVESNMDIDTRDENGQTALHYAAERSWIECIDVLAKHGANFHIIDNCGFSPFLWAVVAGQENAMAKLLIMDPDVLATSAGGKPALTWASSLGWSEAAEMLLEYHDSMSVARPIQAILPLNEAAASGDFPTVQLLLNYGEDPNHRDGDGWSAIHWAAEEGHLEIVQILLHYGADIHSVSSYGTSPLHCAANGGHVSIVNLLLLVGADPLKTTCHGWTALHHAAFMGHSHVIEGLLGDDRVRSNASQQDNHGWSVLHLAIQSRDPVSVRILINKSVIGEPQLLLDDSGLTAEDWLNRDPTSHSQKAIGNLAFSKSRCCRAVTSLRHAVTIDSVPMIRFLSRLGHDINGTNSGRRTALYYAAKKGKLSIMDLLLSLGADPNILPLGRKSWEEFISAPDVLLRLTRSGYKKEINDQEVERQIRQMFREQNQGSQPGWHMSTPLPHEQPPTLDPIASTSAPSHHTDSSQQQPSLPLRAHQTNDNKRKAKPGRANWWRQLMRGN
ncbi:ankyrin repeat domain-containing protein [Fusarium mundagurra]|uniref:Ankyrin repeat domain-containing protein n=1 Tax=Fusarium mundagurra TaxID=1567541 RepID=A0A8H6DNE3_9HYPO|nr:ankyrin repeat domain-containing protein [Fusarium mundagurra]